MDYEKKYKEALERAKVLYSKGAPDSLHLEEMFPELAESEDEKIRKVLVEFFKSYKEQGTCGSETFNGISTDNILSWLEKQKYTQRDVDDAYLKGVTDTKNEMEKQGKQKPPVIDFKAKNWYVSKVDGKIYDMTYNPTDNIGPKFKVGDKVYNIKNGLECTIESIDEACYYCDMTNFDIKDQDGWKLVEQKPTWSEEDEKMLNDIDITFFEEKSIPNVKYWKFMNWLKSLKNRVQPQNLTVTDEELSQAKKEAYNDALNKIEYHSGEPTFDDGWSAAIWYLKKRNIQPQPKQEWSEEDEEIYKIALSCIETLEDISNGKNMHADVKDWLESLKQRLGG